MQASLPTVICPSSKRPRSTRAFSKLTALPTLTLSPIDSSSGARKVIEPITTSLPTLAPSARSHQLLSDEPLSR